MLRRVLLLGVFALGACSTVETSGAGLASPSPTSSNDRIQLRVHTGNEHMDQVVYEIAYQQFSQVLPLREAEPYTGALEITFTSESQNAFLATSNAFTTGNGTANVWYTGGHVGTVTANGSSTTTSVASGTTLEWQNSTMLAVLKNNDGARLWSADYSYKGGWELSGWVVNTPEEAARLVAKRLKAQYVKDTHRGG
ncbi:MAG: hypothetical protein JSR86_18430 [Proteobacteria bacterium]|nr:hypothetical protein [Pseudomonadota bacterium]